MNITRRNVLKGIGIGAAASALPAMAKPSSPQVSVDSWEHVEEATKLMREASRDSNVTYTAGDIVMGGDGKLYKSIEDRNASSAPDIGWTKL